MINELSLGVGLFVVHVGLAIIPIAGGTWIVAIAITVPIANLVVAIRLELHVVAVAIVIPGHELIAGAPWSGVILILMPRSVARRPWLSEPAAAVFLHLMSRRDTRSTRRSTLVFREPKCHGSQQ
jgi:hypothetical protein